MDWGNLWLLGGIGVLSFGLSFIGAAVGLILGHLRLPLLIAYLGSAPAGAATNLIISGVGALAGAARHLREGRVSWNCLALMGIPSVIGAMLAAFFFTRHINHIWSHLVIGIMLVISGVNLARPGTREERPGALGRARLICVEAVIGLGLGMLSAVTGLMLGSLRLPMMMRFLKLDPKVAVGSNMAIGFLTAVAGAATTFSVAAALPWERILTVLVSVGPPTVLGGYLGGWLTGYLRKETVRALAGWIIAITGVLMVGQVVKELLTAPQVELPELTEPSSLEEFDIDDD